MRKRQRKKNFKKETQEVELSEMAGKAFQEAVFELAAERLIKKTQGELHATWSQLH